jgi:glycosyltransferase involved in cell wall biosynthesis
VKLGIVANEYFDRSVSRMGGFGFAAQQVMRVFLDDPSLGVEVVCLPGAKLDFPDPARPLVHGVRAVPLRRGSTRAVLAHAAAVRAERPDVLLTIDYRPSYRRIFRALPRTPVIVWVRDPRTPADWDAIDSLQVPGEEQARPRGIGRIDCTSMRREALTSRLLRRPFLAATLAPHLGAAERMRETYGMTTPVHFLPNIVPAPAVPVEKAERPRVVFLGRLDPIKRPWIVFALAERMPEVEFVVMGQAHFSGKGAWAPASIPANLQLAGHLEGAEKSRLLGSAWLALTTSIHEAVAFSFFEALAHRTPMVSGVEMGGLPARFGAYVGRFDGSGMDGLGAFEQALRGLLADHERRERLGGDGQAWVARVHNRDAFVDAFAGLCAQAGLRAGVRGHAAPRAVRVPHPVGVYGTPA